MGWRGEQGDAAIGPGPAPDCLARAENGQHSGFKERAKPDRVRRPPCGTQERINRSKCTRHYGRATECGDDEFDLRLSCFAVGRGFLQKSAPVALRDLPS
jgi:hypothetical protein